MDKLQRLSRRPATERGFTLIELLVVIIILGILAAVVVFAVSGVGDKGKSAATTIDERTIRTAQEAYCARNGTYASGKQLVTGGFLSELPEYHEVNASQTGGACNGWKYSILRTAAADPYPPGRWDPVAAPGIAIPSYLVRLADGRVLAGGFDASNAWITRIWDPTTNIWTTVGSPPDLPASGNTAILLTDDPLTPENECKGAVVDNCGKVFLYGRYLYDPLFPAAGHPLEWEQLPSPSTCGICNNGPSNFTSNFTYVQMNRSVGMCGATCGKIYMFSQLNVIDVYDPTDNSYVTAPGLVGVAAQSNYATQLPDGRVLICCTLTTSQAKASFFNAASLTVSSDAALPPSTGWFRNSNSQPGLVLPNGDLFFTRERASNSVLRTSGVYTPEALGLGSWRDPSPPNCVDANVNCHPLASLSDGRILAGRSTAGGRVNTRETYLYNPATATWARTPDLPAPSTNPNLAVDAVFLDPQYGPCGANCGKVLALGGEFAAVFTP